MIGFLQGRVAARTAEGCMIDVGGVGYRLSCSASTLAGLPSNGDVVRLWTHLHVREDLLALFGFATESEQRLFEALLTVPGVGPKVALAACSAFTPESLHRALVTDDVAAIAAVPGIGRKTASRILLDLKDKLDPADLDVVGARSGAVAGARSALQNLGYSAVEVRAALAELAPAEDDSVQEVVRSALRTLARDRRSA